MTGRLRKSGNVVNMRSLDSIERGLVSEGLVSKEDVTSAMTRAKRDGVPLGTVLTQSGLITEEEFSRFIGELSPMPSVDLRNYTIDRAVLDLIPEKSARRYNILPLFKIQDVLTVAMSDPMDIIAMDQISALVRCKTESVMAPRDSIVTAIDQWYGVGNTRKMLIDQLVNEMKEVPREQDISQSLDAYGKKALQLRIKLEAEDAPIIKLVNSYLVQGILEEASDIHLEPKKDCLLVRFRIDGLLFDRERLPRKLVAPVISRVKIMSALDISKNRIPQDGRVGLVIRDRHIDIRASTFPSMFGENVVLRILDKSKGPPSLHDLGLSKDSLAIFKKAINATKGVILATGPTGSGKTTTLYSCISTLSTSRKNIMSIEDPIEYEIEGVVQSQVQALGGVTFAAALRSILRQDPDVVYVGEIRDSETAEIAVRAALTGHLVFSTLHTNNAAGALTRLRELGVPRDLLSSVLNCSFAQRLVRKICPRCVADYQPEKALLEKLNLPSRSRLTRGKGCDFCGHTGYRGRTGIFEILAIGKEIRALVESGASEFDIMEVARAQGARTLSEDGLLKVTEGITTYEEIKRVIEEG
jgi:type IV pilus assembly protein PilB